MSTVQPGRFTAQFDQPIVVFLIGMRINKPWKLWKWLPVAASMPKMMNKLAAEPELGLIHSQGGLLGLGPFYVQYWRSFEHLERFARERLLPHLAAWQKYSRDIGNGGDVGVWHETYLVEPGTAESIYANMPVWGLAAATEHVSAVRGRERARERLTVDA